MSGLSCHVLSLPCLVRTMPHRHEHFACVKTCLQLPPRARLYGCMPPHLRAQKTRVSRATLGRLRRRLLIVLDPHSLAGCQQLPPIVPTVKRKKGLSLARAHTDFQPSIIPCNKNATQLAYNMMNIYINGRCRRG